MPSSERFWVRLLAYVIFKIEPSLISPSFMFPCMFEKCGGDAKNSRSVPPAPKAWVSRSYARTAARLDLEPWRAGMYVPQGNWA